MEDRIGKLLLDRLEEIRERGEGDVKLKDVGEIVQELITAIQEEIDGNKEIFDFVSSISDEIISMKSDIMSGYGENEDIQMVSARLASVTESTEKAANIIMDSCEAIQAMLPQLGNEYLAEQMMRNCTKIFEACDFQDLTGQHLTRVMKSVSTIEDIVNKVINALDIQIEAPAAQVDRLALEASAKELMNGPSVGSAPSQEDIDDLFDNA